MLNAFRHQISTQPADIVAAPAYPGVLNAFRHQISTQMEWHGDICNIARAQRLPASDINSDRRQHFVKAFVNVLNAFRHQISTQFCSYKYLAAIQAVLNAFRHQISTQAQRKSASLAYKLSAQRLPASDINSVPIAPAFQGVFECSTPSGIRYQLRQRELAELWRKVLVLNAFRHQISTQKAR